MWKIAAVVIKPPSHIGRVLHRKNRPHRSPSSQSFCMVTMWCTTGTSRSSKTTKMYYGKDTRISMRTTLVTSGLLLIINCNGESTLDFQTSVQGQPVLCPPCDHIFTRLEVDRRGHRVQDIELHERGEPKSGTGFMMDWAGESVIRACEYLKQLYGEETCSVRTRQDPLLSECFLTFDPTKADDDAPCTCEGIER